MDITQFWSIILQIEYDKKKILSGLESFLKKYKNKKILDCACGTGFLTLDLIKRGYDITCSDGSASMLKEFVKNAKELNVKTKPHLLKWSDLSKKFNVQFDLVMCRGSSLVYANSWDTSKINNEKVIKNSLQNFFDCLKPGGLLYLDTTSAQNLKSEKIQIFKYPAKNINGQEVSLVDKISTDKKKRLRSWESHLTIDGTEHIIKRYSRYLSHSELKKMLADIGFVRIRKQKIPGEHYDVFIAEKSF